MHQIQSETRSRYGGNREAECYALCALCLYVFVLVCVLCWAERTRRVRMLDGCPRTVRVCVRMCLPVCLRVSVFVFMFCVHCTSLNVELTLPFERLQTTWQPGGFGVGKCEWTIRKHLFENYILHGARSVGVRLNCVRICWILWNVGRELDDGFDVFIWI